MLKQSYFLLLFFRKLNVLYCKNFFFSKISFLNFYLFIFLSFLHFLLPQKVTRRTWTRPTAPAACPTTAPSTPASTSSRTTKGCPSRRSRTWSSLRMLCTDNNNCNSNISTSPAATSLTRLFSMTQR